MKHIRFDWAIKKILRDKVNYVILEGFISELIGQRIKIDSILESESNRPFEESKLNRVDILARSTQGELLLIEVQNSTEQDYFHRMLYGTSALITEYLNRGEPYNNLKKIYSINIVYFSLGRGDDYVYEGRLEFQGRHLHDRLELSTLQQQLFQIEQIYQIFPEYYLLRVNNFHKATQDGLDEWIYFLKNSEIKDSFVAQGLREAKERLREETLAPADSEAYQKYLKDKQYEVSILATTRASAELEGRQKGREEEQLKIAKTLQQLGQSPEFIAEATGLAIEVVRDLAVHDKFE
jgi:predicted transposase/invertase (TIGR01784 family)